jgi:hypothetical protein
VVAATYIVSLGSFPMSGSEFAAEPNSGLPEAQWCATVNFNSTGSHVQVMQQVGRVLHNGVNSALPSN